VVAVSEKVLILIILFLSAFAFAGAGVFAYSYRETRYTLWIFPYVAYPYREYAPPLIWTGVLIFFAFALLAVAFLLDVKKKPPAPPAPTF
jgi:hypothetical protein